jgi:hypothetical protein
VELNERVQHASQSVKSMIRRIRIIGKKDKIKKTKKMNNERIATMQMKKERQ